jgi:rhodanese-related sulfurtransferase
MGPLVPDVITDELNLLVALLVGVAFGFILEQAGFSSSRKLTGLFYGRDFTVLRVFFTAGVTAMTGIVLLGAVGLLDTSMIFVNPTFLTSALVGGAVMGVGFVLGGYCPGTSFCGAAVGRIDAMLFVVGGLVGAFAFGEAFPWLQDLYMARGFGDLTLPVMFGVPPGLVATIATLVAIAAFIVTGRIERRVNPTGPVSTFPIGRHRLAAIGLIGVTLLVARLDRPETRLLAQASDPAHRLAHPVRRITADEVAFRLLDGDPRLQVIDTRSREAFTALRLPRALNIPLNDLFGKAWRDVLAQPHTLKVFVADDEGAGTTAASLASLLGYVNVAVLEGGLQRFRADLLEAPTGEPIPSGRGESAAFRQAAGPKLMALIKAQSTAKPVVRTAKKVAGGCGV